MASATPLPSSEGFRSKAYWRAFFAARGGEAPFEWYGEARHLRPNLLALLRAVGAGPAPAAAAGDGPALLVPGCGNSALSEALFAAGVARAITNVDFDGGVIRGMRRRTRDSCPGMRWIEADARALPRGLDARGGGDGSEFDNGGGGGDAEGALLSAAAPRRLFDIVLDKGLLDAMLSGGGSGVEGTGGKGSKGKVDSAAAAASALEADAESARDAVRMLDECWRLLRPGGAHVIVSLLQDSVLVFLLRWAAGLRTRGGGGVGAARVEIAPLAGDSGSLSTTSALCPFFVAIFKDGGAAAPPPSSTPQSRPPPPATVFVPRSFRPATPKAAAPAPRYLLGGLDTRFEGDLAAAAAARSESDAVEAPLIALGGAATAGGSSEGAPAVAAAAAEESGPEAAAAALTVLCEAVHRVQWQWHCAHQLATVTGSTHLALELWTQRPGQGQGPAPSPAPAPAGAGAAEEAAVVIGIVAPAGVAPYAAEAAAAAGGAGALRPRYTATIVDAGKPPAAGAAPRCAVLLVPQGREHEFSFAVREGQAALARQARVDRLVFVAMSRGHRYGSLAAVQRELSPAVLSMVPALAAEAAGRASATIKSGEAEAGGRIPFLAVADDIGARFVLAEGSSALSGAFVIEDVPEDDGGSDDEGEAPDEPHAAAAAASASAHAEAAAGSLAAPGRPKRRLLRRLVFLSNRNAIQSEALLRVAADGSSSVRTRRLRFPYHRAMAAALALADSGTAPDGALSVAVIGLGGGGLAAYIAASGAAVGASVAWGRGAVSVTAVELDPAIVSVARSHFGLRVAGGEGTGGEGAGSASAGAGGASAGAGGAGGAGDAGGAGAGEAGAVRVVVGDGLDFVRSLAESPASAGRLHGLLVDVDAKDRDMQLGLSFPPAAFVGRPFLRAARAALAPGGVLVVNLGSRSKALFAGAIAAIEKEFGATRVVTMLPGEEGDEGGGGGEGDLNRVVVAGGAPGGWPAPAAAEARALAMFGSTRTAAALRGLAAASATD